MSCGGGKKGIHAVFLLISFVKFVVQIVAVIKPKPLDHKKGVFMTFASVWKRSESDYRIIDFFAIDSERTALLCTIAKK